MSVRTIAIIRSVILPTPSPPPIPEPRFQSTRRRQRIAAPTASISAFTTRLLRNHQPLVDLSQSIQNLMAGLKRMNFKDVDFRSSELMRLKVLQGHIDNNRLERRAKMEIVDWRCRTMSDCSEEAVMSLNLSPIPGAASNVSPLRVQADADAGQPGPFAGRQ